MKTASGDGKYFLFLQGPHGPFFSQLGEMLRLSGARVRRIGFNAGDAFFWRHRESFTPYRGSHDDWPSEIHRILTDEGVTDLVLYGDTRPIHAEAIEAARAAGVTIHCFEEGYLRPYWVTYERGGVNGNSRLMEMDIAEMRAQLAESDPDLRDVPANWGDMRQHVFYGALYHFQVLARNGAFRNFRPHRRLTVRREFRLHLRRLLLMPLHAAQRRIATRRIHDGRFAYHLALLQLSHDASVQHHSDIPSMSDFLDRCLAAFAAGAPVHHHLVVKAHPLEDGREPLQRHLRRAARALGLSGRVHFVRGGKLAALLDQARSAVTVNSTAAQQALWRGVPVRAFGRAVYGKPELVSRQPLDAFFAAPEPPDTRAYRDYRHYLTETCQVQGGFYSSLGRRRLLRLVVDMVLADEDPYERLSAGDAAMQQLKIVE